MRAPGAFLIRPSIPAQNYGLPHTPVSVAMATTHPNQSADDVHLPSIHPSAHAQNLTAAPTHYHRPPGPITAAGRPSFVPHAGHTSAATGVTPTNQRLPFHSTNHQPDLIHAKPNSQTVATFGTDAQSSAHDLMPPSSTTGIIDRTNSQLVTANKNTSATHWPPTQKSSVTEQLRQYVLGSHGNSVHTARVSSHGNSVHSVGVSSHGNSVHNTGCHGDALHSNQFGDHGNRDGNSPTENQSIKKPRHASTYRGMSWETHQPRVRSERLSSERMEGDDSGTEDLSPKPQVDHYFHSAWAILSMTRIYPLHDTIGFYGLLNTIHSYFKHD